MSTAETPPPEFELVIAEDGSIPSEQLAQYGLRPGLHLRVIPGEGISSAPRRRLEGALVGKINVAAFEEGLRSAKDERLADIERHDS